MQYIRVLDGIVKEKVWGAMPEPSVTNEKIIEVSDFFDGEVGDDIRMYTKDMKRRPLVELVNDGFIPVPKGYKVDPDRNQFVVMNDDELIDSGQLDGDELTTLRLQHEYNTLFVYLEETRWMAERQSDYLASNGKYGKLMDEETLKKRQAARDRISEIRTLIPPPPAAPEN